MVSHATHCACQAHLDIDKEFKTLGVNNNIQIVWVILNKLTASKQIMSQRNIPHLLNGFIELIHKTHENLL